MLVKLKNHTNLSRSIMHVKKRVGKETVHCAGNFVPKMLNTDVSNSA